jgi:hypothetical protein
MINMDIINSVLYSLNNLPYQVLYSAWVYRGSLPIRTVEQLSDLVNVDETAKAIGEALRRLAPPVTPTTRCCLLECVTLSAARQPTVRRLSPVRLVGNIAQNSNWLYSTDALSNATLFYRGS